MEIDAVAYLAVDGDELREGLLDAEDEDDRQTNESERRTLSSAEPSVTPIRTGVPNRSQQLSTPPPTPEELELAITERRDRVRNVSAQIDDYIVGLACPAMIFTIANIAESFLYDLRVVITFAGAARGAKKIEPNQLEYAGAALTGPRDSSQPTTAEWRSVCAPASAMPALAGAISTVRGRLRGRPRPC